MQRRPYSTLRRIILANMILLPLIPFVLVLVIGYGYFRSSLESNTIARMQRIVEDHSQLITLFLEERKADLQLIADSYNFDRLYNTDLVGKILEHIQKNSPAFGDLGIFNEEGVHVAYYGPYDLKGKVYKDTEWFTKVMRRGYYISDVFLGYRKVPHFIIAVAKKYETGTWVVRATIDSQLFDDLVEKVRIGATGQAYIVNREGILQTRRFPDGNLMDKDEDAAKYLTPHEGIRTFIDTSLNGTTYWYATSWLKNNEWMLVVRQEKAEVFRTLTAATYLVLLIAVLGGLVIVPVAFYTSSRIIARMEKTYEEKRQLGQQLIAASRLAEIGEMSAGVAHEINNPLQIIRLEQNMIESILADLKESGELKDSKELTELLDSLNQIKLQVHRCADITQSLLKFARQRESTVSTVDLRTFIPEVVGVVRRRAEAEGITIKEYIAGTIPLVKGNASQIQQVLLNLLNNAFDAILARHGSQGGELTVSAQLADIGWIKISVTDNGVGISPENREKIFTPFFTTKPMGKGTGLGLSVCHGIIKQMGGSIHFASELGKGTTFTILLPSADSYEVGDRGKNEDHAGG
jgi:two-component system NtrC family sensor kinase